MSKMDKNEKKKLEERVVNFYSGKKEYRSLSNFWECEVVVMGEGGENRVYESGEHCFHGEKYIRNGLVCEDERRREVLLEYGRRFLKPSRYQSGGEVKKMGGKKGLLMNGLELSRWSNMSTGVQEEICKYKMEAYEEVREDIRKSGDKLLVHPALRCSEEKLVNSRVWEGKGVLVDGEVVVIGRNLLGKIWMGIREEKNKN
jgi:predicted NAD-dependent protein-ADP-ribosyltransferase YbiA (DUF1768 family)